MNKGDCLDEAKAWAIALVGLVLLTAATALFVRDAFVSENYQMGQYYVHVLQDSGVNVTYVASLRNVDNINTILNPLKLPANYSLTCVSTFGNIPSFLNTVSMNNISNIYFAWQVGSWTLAYLQLHPEYQGAEISSYSENA